MHGRLLTLKVNKDNINTKLTKLSDQRTDPLTELKITRYKEFQAEMMREVTKESGMDKCPLCEGLEVITNLEPQKPDDTGIVKSYIVKYICNDCKKGWKVTVTLGQEQIVKATLASISQDQYVMHLLYLVLCQAREQIEKFCRHKSETESVEEDDTT